MAINMPSMDQIRGRIDVPDVRGAADFAAEANPAEAHFEAAIGDAGVASAAERSKIDVSVGGVTLGSRERGEQHSGNVDEAVKELARSEIEAMEMIADRKITPDELVEYAGQLGVRTAELFTQREDRAFDTTWKGRLSRVFKRGGPVSKIVKSSVVPAALTTGAILTGGGALAAGAVIGGKMVFNRVRRGPSSNEKDQQKRQGILTEQVTEAAEAAGGAGQVDIDDARDAGSFDIDIDAALARGEDFADTGHLRQKILAEVVTGTNRHARDALRDSDRKWARVGLGVTVAAGVLGAVSRFTDAGDEIRDVITLKPIRERVGGVLSKIGEIFGEVDSPIELHARNPLTGNSPIETHNPFASENVHTGSGSGAGDHIADQADNSAGGGSGGLEDNDGGTRDTDTGTGTGSYEDETRGSDGQSPAEDRVGVNVDEKEGSDLDEQDTHLGPQDAAEDRVGSEENPVDVDEQDHPADQPTEGDTTVETEIPDEAQDEYDDLVSAFDSHEGVSHADAEIRARQIVTNEDGAGDRFRAWIEGASDSPAGDHQPGTPGADNVTELPNAQPEEVTLNVPEGEGFENSLQQQYDLTDAEAAQAYQAMRPALLEAYNADPANSGMYMVGNDIRISSPGAFHLNPQASGALNQFLDTLHEENTLEEAA